MTIATYGRFAPLGTSGVVIHGTNSFGESNIANGGLQLEGGNFNNPTSPVNITWSTLLSDGAMVTIQNADFGYALGGPQANDDPNTLYLRTKFYNSLAQAKNAAEGSPDHFLPQHRFIRTTNGLAQLTNYHVYDTIVGDQGVRLSGGQKQRIALARALLKDPPILVLDEATAMFDPEGEAEFIAECHEVLKQRTVILITHRPASLALADRVLRLDAGRLNGVKDSSIAASRAGT
jgi:hypothetical protein